MWPPGCTSHKPAEEFGQGQESHSLPCLGREAESLLLLLLVPEMVPLNVPSGSLCHPPHPASGLHPSYKLTQRTAGNFTHALHLLACSAGRVHISPGPPRPSDVAGLPDFPNYFLQHCVSRRGGCSYWRIQMDPSKSAVCGWLPQSQGLWNLLHLRSSWVIWVDWQKGGL